MPVCRAGQERAWLVAVELLQAVGLVAEKVLREVAEAWQVAELVVEMAWQQVAVVWLAQMKVVPKVWQAVGALAAVALGFWVCWCRLNPCQSSRRIVFQKNYHS